MAGLAGCGDDPTKQAPGNAARAEKEVHWTYEDAAGPERWGDLSTEFAACAAGRRQSPIDLGRAARSDLADVELDYQPASYEVVNTGHTVQANATGAGGIRLDGEFYKLVQFHAHTPSEHTVDGEAADVGLHLVHANDAGELVVVGVLVQKGGTGALDDAWPELPAEGESRQLDSFDASRLLPEDTESYRYDGSLTTPPCTENVGWVVMQEPTTVDSELVSSFRELFGPNARPTQPLNGRVLGLDTNAG